MSYQNLTLRGLAGRITATYNDNNLKVGNNRPELVGPSIFATGTAKRGFKNEAFLVRDIAEAMQEFDSRSEVAKIIQASREIAGRTPLSVARIGAKPFHFVIEQQIDGFKEKEAIITITPGIIQEGDAAERIQSTFESFKLLLSPFAQGNLIRQRVIIVAVNEQTQRHRIAYDSERQLIVNGDIAFDVTINVPFGTVLYTPEGFDSSDQLNGTPTLEEIKILANKEAFKFVGLPTLNNSSAVILSAVNIVDTSALTNMTLTAYNGLNLAKPFSLDKIDGKAGEHINHLERYAGNEEAYERLEFEDIDYLYCEGCFANINPVNLSSSLSMAKSVSWGEENLGFFWKYQFNGRPYMMFFGRQTPFSAANVSGYTHDSIEYVLSGNQELVGDLLNLVEFHLYAEASGASTSVESFINKKGIIECHVKFANDVDRTQSGSELVTPFATLKFGSSKFDSGGTLIRRLRPSVIDGTRTVSDWILDNPQQVNNDPFVVTHFDLTGGLVPEAIIERLMTFDTTANTVTLVAKAVEVREVSFLHQAAQAAYVASTNYSQTIALVPTTAPQASFNGVSAWAGNPGVYQVESDGSLVITENGTGVLGTKLLAGAVGYRNSAAFGGVILTNGSDLPNEIPYGINDQDEALDSSGNPIDLGKHAIVIGAWGLMTNPEISQQQRKIALKARLPGQAFYFGNAAPKIASMLATLRPGTEPIGPTLGAVAGFQTQQRTPKSVLNNLAALRICMIDQTGVISSINTAALRTSDYRKVSSITSANAIISLLRAECMPVIGRAFTDSQMASLQANIEGVERSLVKSGFCQSIRTRLSASSLDRINGVLRLAVVFVPPFSIEAITINVTLEAPQS